MTNISTAIATQERTVVYEVPNQKDLVMEGEVAYHNAEFTGVEIKTKTDLDAATADMNACAKRVKELEALRKSITKPMDEAKKAVMNIFNPVIDRYSQAITIYKRGIADYHDRAEAAALAARLEAEKAAAEQRQALALAAEQATDESEKEALQDAAASIIAAPVAVAAKVEGATVRKKLKAEVVDLAAFLRYAADHPELHGCISIKAGALDRYVAATGGAVEIAGVKFHEETTIACRSN